MDSSGTSTVSVSDGTGCPGNGAPDAAGNAWVTSIGNLYYLDIASSLTAPTITTVSGSANGSSTGNGGTGGLDGAAGFAIDGLGNVWAYNRPSSSGIGGLSEFKVATSGGTTTVTPLSPGGSATTQAGEFGFQTDGATAGEGVQIDASGNLWINTTGGTFL